MITIQINGQSQIFNEAMTIENLISHLKFNRTHIAVALNFDVVPRAEFSKIKIKDGDTVDILHPSQGG